MSSLASNEQGKTLAWHKRTAKLRVRSFCNPSAPGTCCQVLDGAGSPLILDADIDYTEFRRAVSGVPGLYRLDQCDEDGVGLEDAAPALPHLAGWTLRQHHDAFTRAPPIARNEAA